MKFTAGIALLCFALPIYPQTPPPQTCDLKLFKVSTRWDLSAHAVQLMFFSKNDTQKVVVGAKFGAYTLDAVKDRHEYPQSFVNEYKHKPGKDVGSLENLSLINRADAEGGAIVWVQKVLYADGTKWEDNGTRSCQMEGK